MAILDRPQRTLRRIKPMHPAASPILLDRSAEDLTAAVGTIPAGPCQPPMLHPLVNFPFKWAGELGKVHAQRKSPDSLRLHSEWFYIELPDGSFHEVQYSRLRTQLETLPVLRSTTCIAMALAKESDQSPEKLRELVKACGL